MKRLAALLLVLGSAAWHAAAVAPPPEKLLPKDTVLVVTAPDGPNAWSVLTNMPYGRLWLEPAVKPFRDKFIEKFKADLIGPLEKQFGIAFADYGSLMQGQVTFALLPGDEAGKPAVHFSQVLLIDAKDHAGQLKKSLAELKKKWADSGKQMKSDKIRDVEFTTYLTTSDEISWQKIFPKPKDPDAPPDDPDAKPAVRKVEISIGQSDSLLVVGNSTKAIEKILSRQAGGLIPALEEYPAFQTDFAARLRGAPIYAWVNTKALADIFARPEPAGGGVEPAANEPKADTPYAALGLDAMTSASFTYHDTPEGGLAQFFVAVPEGNRRGIFKALAADANDSNPPVFVPADAVKFWRWRLNIPKSWAVIESTLTEVNPSASGILNWILESAGKDKDEKYDLKAELLGNLGNDVICYERNPRSSTLADLHSAPTLYLIGSPNPAKLAAALKVALNLLPHGPEGIQEREFLGRTICTLPPANGAARAFNFAASGGYVALSTDTDILEEYLRSSGANAKALNDTPGLAAAAAKVGGFSTGFFEFSNQNENMRVILDILRKEPVGWGDILGTSMLPPNINSADEARKLKDWADFSLLPPWDALSKYFYYSVSSASFTPEGFVMSIFSPTPPQLKQP